MSDVGGAKERFVRLRDAGRRQGVAYGGSAAARRRRRASYGFGSGPST